MKSFNVLIMISCFLWSCQVKLDDIPKTQIDQTLKDAPDLYWFESQGVIYLRGITKLYYNPFDEEEVFLSEIYMDGQLIHSDADNIGMYSMDSRVFADGEHELTIHLYTASETGSIADKLGVESVLHTYTRNAIVDNAPLEMNFDEAQFAIEDSVLIFQWPKFEDYGFSKYQVRVITNPHSSQETFEFTDPNYTSFSFPQFAGGAITLELKLFAKNSSLSKTVQYTHWYSPTMSISEEEILTVSVEESPFRAFDKFEVEHSHTTGLPNDLLQLTKIAPNTFQTQLRTFFPTNKTVTLFYKDKSGLRRQVSVVSNIGVWNGLGKTRILEDRYVTTNGTKIEVRNFQNELLGEWTATKANISNDGQDGYIINGTQIEKIDPLTLQKTPVCNTMNITRVGNYGSPTAILPTNGDQLILVKALGKGYNLIYGALYIINVNTCELIKEFNYNWDNYGNPNPTIDYRNSYFNAPNNLIVFQNEYCDITTADYLNTNPEILKFSEYHSMGVNSYFTVSDNFYLKVDGNVIRKIKYSMNDESEVEIGTFETELPILHLITDNEFKYGTVHHGEGIYFMNIYDLNTNELLNTVELNPGFNLGLLSIYGNHITFGQSIMRHKMLQ